MLNGKVVVITGGGGLIGKELAKAVASHKGIAVVADINKKQAQKAVNELVETYGSNAAMAITLDITSKASIKQCIKKLHKKYGRIDALVNNAYPRNKHYGRHFFDVTYKDFVENVGLNLGGYFLTSQQFAKYFQKQGQGNIVNIASIYGVIAPKFDIYSETSMTTPVEYAAIKSALIHLTKYMATYLKHTNIRINSISPGGIYDNQLETFVQHYNAHCLNKGILDKEDISGTLVYLLSDMSAYVNGQNIIVDDGFTL